MVVIKDVVAVTEFGIGAGSCTKDIIIFGCSDDVLHVGIRIACSITTDAAGLLEGQWTAKVNIVQLERDALCRLRVVNGIDAIFADKRFGLGACNKRVVASGSEYLSALNCYSRCGFDCL